MDIEILKQILATGSVSLSSVAITFYVIKAMVTLGDKYLTKQLDVHSQILSGHEKERAVWMAALDNFNKALEKASGYHREEHARMIQILENINHR